jgi:hypothetical protein
MVRETNSGNVLGFYDNEHDAGQSGLSFDGEVIPLGTTPQPAGPLAWMKLDTRPDAWDKFNFSTDKQSGFETALYAAL